MRKKFKFLLISENKFFIKTSLILLQLFERIIFIISALSGALILVDLFRGTFISSPETYLKILIYLLLDLTGNVIHLIKVNKFKKLSKNWNRIPPILTTKDKKNSNIKSLRKIYYKYISQVNDYNLYSLYLIIITITSGLILFATNMRAAIINWLLTFLLSIFIFKNYLKIVSYLRIEKIQNLIFSLVNYIPRKLKINFHIYQLLNTYIIIILVFSFIIFPVKDISIIESLAAVFGIRQILSSIRGILTKKTLEVSNDDSVL